MGRYDSYLDTAVCVIHIFSKSIFRLKVYLHVPTADKYGGRKHKGYLRKIARAGKEETLDYASLTFDTYLRGLWQIILERHLQGVRPSAASSCQG
jgi:hypothetical protein